MQQRDAKNTPQIFLFRFAVNSPYSEHLTRILLLCLLYCYCDVLNPGSPKSPCFLGRGRTATRGQDIPIEYVCRVQPMRTTCQGQA